MLKGIITTFFKPGTFIFIFIATILVLVSIFLSNKDWVNLFISPKFLEKSEVRLSTEGMKFKINFHILDKDQSKLSLFSRNLGAEDTSWTQGIALELDKNTLEYLSSNLPLDLSLNFFEREAQFSSQSLIRLSSGLPSESYEISTRSGKLTLKYSNAANFDLFIKNPEDLVLMAISSGTLKLSDRLQALFPILSKVATIELEVKDQAVKGRIILK